MTKRKMANRYSPEFRARAVRMVFEHQGSYETSGRDSGYCTQDRLHSPDPEWMGKAGLKGQRHAGWRDDGGS